MWTSWAYNRNNIFSDGVHLNSILDNCEESFCPYIKHFKMLQAMMQVLLALLYYNRHFNSLSSFDNYLYDFKFCYRFIINFSGLCDDKCQYAIRIHTVWNIFNVGLLESFFLQQTVPIYTTYLNIMVFFFLFCSHFSSLFIVIIRLQWLTTYIQVFMFLFLPYQESQDMF